MTIKSTEISKRLLDSYFRRFRCCKWRNGFVAIVCWGWVGLCAVQSGNGVLNNAGYARVIQRSIYDVVPSEWITGGADMGVVDATSGEQNAFIFPSPALANAEHDPEPYPTPAGFFTPSNRFPEEDTFHWPKAKPEVQITVHRGSNPIGKAIDQRKVSRDAAVFVVERESLQAIGRLEWTEVCELQREFRRWLVRRSGCLFPDERRFRDLQPSLETFWRKYILKLSDFSKFAATQLKAEDTFDVSYTNEKGEYGTATMKAILLSPGERISISWGGVGVYPFGPQGIITGNTRFTVGGSGEEQVYYDPTSRGLSLSLPREPQMNAEPMLSEKNPKIGDVQLPLPRQWAGLWSSPNAVFIPIYNPNDINNAQLLSYTGTKTPATKKPRYLFLLMPVSYVKADTGNVKNVNQFVSDARKGYEYDEKSPLQLVRSYMLVGNSCATKDAAKAAVQKDLGRLLEAAARNSPSGKDETKKANDRFYKEEFETLVESADLEGYTIGVFMNQTSVKAGYHITLGDMPMDKPVAHQQTWGGLVDCWKLSLLAEPSDPQGQPALEVRRTERSFDGALKKSMRVRFHTTAKTVLDSAYVQEGDELKAMR